MNKYWFLWLIIALVAIMVCLLSIVGLLPESILTPSGIEFKHLFTSKFIVINIFTLITGIFTGILGFAKIENNKL